MRDLSLLRLDGPLSEDLSDPVIVLALDGWTDAGRAGTMAADVVRERWQTRRIGVFDGDALYDYRDRRPMLTIDRGLLGDLVWPSLEVHQVTAPDGNDILLVQGAEPDLGWRALGTDLVTMARMVGSSRYVGLGAVPGPVPHTRPVSVVVTGSDEEVLERAGRPHERLTVPASCQVAMEACLRDEGLRTLGLWVRVPHYVAGDYPAAAAHLTGLLADELGTEIDLSGLRQAADQHRTELDEAATSSEEVVAHIRQLEVAYDQEIDGGHIGPIPSADEIAAEVERFLRRQTGDS